MGKNHHKLYYQFWATHSLLKSDPYGALGYMIQTLYYLAVILGGFFHFEKKSTLATTLSLLLSIRALAALQGCFYTTKVHCVYPLEHKILWLS